MIDASFGRANDRKKRLEALKATYRATYLYQKSDPFMRDDYLRHAKMFGQDSKELGERIKSHDYTDQDRRDLSFLEVIRRPRSQTTV